jgi:hypothetical protein
MLSQTPRYQALSGSDEAPPWSWTGTEGTRRRREWGACIAGAAMVLALLVLVGLSVSPAGTTARLAKLTAEGSDSSATTTNMPVGETAENAPIPVHAADAVEREIASAHNALKQQRVSLKDPLLADFPSEVTESLNLSTAPCDNFYEYAW